MNFKNYLDKNNVEYHYYGKHNVLSIEYSNNENWVEIKNQIEILCEKYGFVNGTKKLHGSAVLEVSKNPQIIQEFGFESEPYVLGGINYG